MSPPVLETTNVLSERAAGRDYVCVAAFVDDARALFVLIDTDSRGWELPGGAIETTETAVEAATRELREEAGHSLDHPQLVAEIHNVRPDGSLHSRSWLVAGYASAPLDASSRYRWQAGPQAPVGSSFPQVWINELLARCRDQLSRFAKQNLWNIVADDYSSKTTISTEVVHYGPLLPGEDQLHLLPALSGRRVLELGCGDGSNLLAAARAGASGVGVDISEHNRTRAERVLIGTSMSVVHGDFETVDYSALAKPHGCFDVVISVFAMAFVADIVAVFARLRKVLAPGAVIVLATDHPARIGAWDGSSLSISNWFGPRSRTRQWAWPGGEIPYLHTVHSLPTLVEAMRAAGAAVEQVLEPVPLAKSDLHAAPYRSAYFESRYDELSSVPYTIVVRAATPDSPRRR